MQVPLLRGQNINSLTTDREGNLILTGTNVDGGFISKLDPSGNVVFTFANFGSYPAGAVVDPDGDIYWFGAAGFSFPFTKTVLEISDIGSSVSSCGACTISLPNSPVPGFVVKFHGADGSIVWAAEIDAMQPSAMALDANGNLTLAGYATTAPGLTTPGAYMSPAAGTGSPLSIVRLSAAGDAIFAASYGGHTINGASSCVSSVVFRCVSDPVTYVSAVLLDLQGHIWIAGSTNEIDLPVTADAVKNMCGCSLNSGDGYLAEFSSDGSTLLYATYLGTSTEGTNDTRGDDAILAGTMDSLGRIWLTGRTDGTDLPVTPEAIQANLIGDSDGFVLEYDPVANLLIYATYYGTEADNNISHVVIGADGMPLLAGYLGYDRFGPYSSGHDFVAVLTPFGIDAVSLLRDGADGGLAITPSGSVVVAGSGSVLTVMDEAPDTAPNILGIGNNASLDGGGQVSPGEIVTIVGTNLGPANPLNAQLAAGQLTVGTMLGGVRVSFDGTAAPLLYVSSTRITAIVPFGIASQRETILAVEYAGVSSNQALLGVVPAVPGIFTSQAVYQHLPVAAALNEDGTINSENNRARPGSIVSIFATGFGGLMPQPVDGSIVSGALPVLQQDVLLFGPNGLSDEIYAGPAPGEVAGVMQVNFRLPQTITYTPTMTLFAGGWAAPYFTVWVEGT